MEDKQILNLTTEQEQVINDLITDFFQHLDINGEFDLMINESSVDVVLDTPDTGIVIGYHGEILDSLQLLLSMIVSKKLGQFIRLSLEVGDYKKNRAVYLENLAEQIKSKVISENREYTLPSLKPWERRIVHLHLQGDDSVSTESIGDGKERTLVIRPKA